MKIGIVTTWFERGAAYVSEIYMKLLEKEGHTVYIFARGGEIHSSKKDERWNQMNITRSEHYFDSTVSKHDINKWIKKNKIEAILFNEQREYLILPYIKKKFPDVILGAYVDYYTEDTLKYFDFYDFVICNTKRHMQAMKFHKQKFYVPWGTDINLYKPFNIHHNELTFFHSVGMSERKGTDILVDAFIDGECYKRSKLIIHTQIPIQNVCRYTKEELLDYNIEIIEKTVTAPGLYYEGDVYVYPTRLDGLGLTMYEALSSGMPLITTDFPPMNEVGDESCVRRVKVKDYYCRSDAYYFPMVICDKASLIGELKWFIKNKDKIELLKKNARQYALNNYDIFSRSKEISNIFENAHSLPLNVELERVCKKNNIKKFTLNKWFFNFYWVYFLRYR